MTDFFDRLLARQRPVTEPGAVTRARPRVPTLFERSRAAELEETTVARAPAPPPVLVAPARPAVPPAHVPPFSAPRPAAAAPVRGAEGHPAETGPAAVAAAIGSPDPAPPELAPRAVVHPAPPAPPVPSRTGPDPSPPAARPATVPQLVAPAGLPAVPQRSPALTAPAVPFPAAAADRRTRRAEPPGRTVQVHIGRIEVSAPPRPEAGPERARRRGPDLTLEKYLGGAEARHE